MMGVGDLEGSPSTRAYCSLGFSVIWALSLEVLASQEAWRMVTGEGRVEHGGHWEDDPKQKWEAQHLTPGTERA